MPGDAFPVLRFHGVDIAMCVCEDLWQDGGPVAVAARAEVGLVVCINGSPYERLKSYTRDELAARRAAEAGAVLAYVNMVGGQDELVFDGDSLIVDADGELCARAPQFEETLLVSDLDFPAADRQFSGPVDASDGTRMHVERITVVAEALPRFDPAAADRSSTGSIPTPSCTPRSCSGRATTSPRTVSAASSSACRAASIPLWWRRSPSTRSAPTPCTPSRCRPRIRRTIPSATRRSSPNVSTRSIRCCPSPASSRRTRAT